MSGSQAVAALESAVDEFIEPFPQTISEIAAFLTAHPVLVSKEGCEWMRGRATFELDADKRNRISVLADYVRHAWLEGIDRATSFDNEQLVQQCIDTNSTWEQLVARLERLGVHRAFGALSEDCRKLSVSFPISPEGPFGMVVHYLRAAVLLGAENARLALDLHGSISIPAEVDALLAQARDGEPRVALVLSKIPDLESKEWGSYLFRTQFDAFLEGNGVWASWLAIARDQIQTTGVAPKSIEEVANHRQRMVERLAQMEADMRRVLADEDGTGDERAGEIFRVACALDPDGIDAEQVAVRIGNQFGLGFSRSHDALLTFRFLYQSQLIRLRPDHSGYTQALNDICLGKLLTGWVREPFGKCGNLRTAMDLFRSAQEYFNPLEHAETWCRLQLDIASLVGELSKLSEAEAPWGPAPEHLRDRAETMQREALAISSRCRNVSLTADLHRALAGVDHFNDPAADAERLRQLHHAVTYLELGKRTTTPRAFARRINSARIARIKITNKELLRKRAVPSLWRWETSAMPAAALRNKFLQMTAYVVMRAHSLGSDYQEIASQLLERYTVYADRELKRFTFDPHSGRLWYIAKRFIVRALSVRPSTHALTVIELRRHLHEIHEFNRHYRFLKEEDVALDEAILLMHVSRERVVGTAEIAWRVNELLDRDRTHWSAQSIALLFHYVGTVIGRMFSRGQKDGHNLDLAIDLVSRAHAAFAADPSDSTHWEIHHNLMAFLKLRGHPEDLARLKVLYSEYLREGSAAPEMLGPSISLIAYDAAAARADLADEPHDRRLRIALLHRAAEQQMKMGEVFTSIESSLDAVREVARMADWRAVAEESESLRRVLLQLCNSAIVPNHQPYDLLSQAASLEAAARCELGELEEAWKAIESAKFITANSTKALARSAPGERQLYREAARAEQDLLRAMSGRLADEQPQRGEPNLSESTRIYQEILSKAVPDFGPISLVTPDELPRGTALCYLMIDAGMRSLVLHRVDGRVRIDASTIESAKDLTNVLYPPDQRSWYLCYQEAFRSMEGGLHYRPESDAGAGSPFARWGSAVQRTVDGLGRSIMQGLDAQLRRCGVGADTHVFIVMPGILSALPILTATISDDSGGTRAFCDVWPSSIVPSGLVARRCVDSLGVLELSSSIVVIHSPKSRAKNLPGFEAELHMLSQVADGREINVLSGKSARLAEVESRLPGHRYIHFACHAHVDDEDSCGGLLLSGGDVLYPAEVSTRLSLAGVRLVFLSACETGRSNRAQAADESIGLPASMLAAGASSVIATLWPIFDDAAVVFSRFLYQRHLVEGRSIVESFRLAVRALREVSFEELRVLFPVISVGDAEYLRLAGSAGVSPAEPRLFESPSSVTPPRRPRGLSLRIGQPAARPFTSPLDWATFCLFGI